MKTQPIHAKRWPLLSATMIAWSTLAGAVPAEDADKLLMERARQWFKPLPDDMATVEHPTSTAAVTLGRKLFFDPRISVDGTVSCANCHRPALYGTDALPQSIGVDHRLNARNAPTVLNAALQIKAHWIGDRENVEEQAAKSLVGRNSFGNPDMAAAARRIKQLPGYEAEFRQAFPNDREPITPENWGKAIGAYERTLVTPSPFDAYLKGNANALSPAAQDGLKAFIELGCVSCHNGAGLGGTTFTKFGIFGEYWKETGSQTVDEGRFTETKDPSDKWVFKVPMLRNAAMTPPYFHDGSVATLAEAIRIMAKLQLDKELSSEQLDALSVFLASLTGQLPDTFVTEPALAPKAFTATTP